MSFFAFIRSLLPLLAAKVAALPLAYPNWAVLSRTHKDSKQDNAPDSLCMFDPTCGMYNVAVGVALGPLTQGAKSSIGSSLRRRQSCNSFESVVWKGSELGLGMSLR